MANRMGELTKITRNTHVLNAEKERKMNKNKTVKSSSEPPKCTQYPRSILIFNNYY